MLKNIKQIKDIQVIEKTTQRVINGGGPSYSCSYSSVQCPSGWYCAYPYCKKIPVGPR